MTEKPIHPEPISAPALEVEHSVLPEEARQQDSTIVFGFWMYLMTDLILFSALFAVFVVLRGTAFGGMGLNGLFSAKFALEETLILLTSSFTAGLSLLGARAGKKGRVITCLLLTGLLGISFLYLELSEFARLAAEGHSWRASGALSAFFTLVGTHGLHIFIGLLWLGALITAILRRGFTRPNMRKLLLWSAFWHFLDLVWIFIFTIVYLMSL